MNAPPFPRGFLFGAATSAYQIEGGHDADGRGPSVWDTFARRSGRVHRAHTGDVACDTYRDFATDVAIMRRLGLGAYRFSISWSRVLPRGRGAVNGPGLDYYDRLVDALLAADIKPFVTLFHWDMPQALQDEVGGFAGRDSAAHFADYVAVVARRLGDRVGHWITLNEPWVYATLGHLRGLHAPGRMNPWAFLRAVHHQLLGHGLAVERLRAIAPAAQVGLSLNLSPIYPATDRAADHAAARLADQAVNRLFLDPLFRGHYPEPLWSRLRLFRPHITPGDMATIATPIDFVGVNYYTRAHVRRAWYVPFLGLWPEGLPVLTGQAVPAQDGPDDAPRYSGMGWEVYPAGLFELLWRLKTEYGNPPVYVTENGAAYPDVLTADGRVHDEARRAYLEQHLGVVAAAAQAGADVRGYFAWSLLDNFEWTYGYDKRFGLVYVDFASQRRVIKDSGWWYSELIRRQAAVSL
jgi:beta-glucosidase